MGEGECYRRRYKLPAVFQPDSGRKQAEGNTEAGEEYKRSAQVSFPPLVPGFQAGGQDFREAGFPDLFLGGGNIVADPFLAHHHGVRLPDHI